MTLHLLYWLYAFALSMGGYVKGITGFETDCNIFDGDAKMNVVMIIPTGIRCEIGGHAGDATPVARLLGACCNELVLHPNVVNASDINEMPENAWYVEGSHLDRFLRGEIELQKVRQNRILVAVNFAQKETINAVSAARASLGVDATMLVLDSPLNMVATMTDGRADGEVTGWKALVEQVQKHEFDALALSTPIEVEDEINKNYWENGGVNPWGGVEAKASKLIATALNKPVAHAPVMVSEDTPFCLHDWDFVADPRMAAEVLSWAFLHCVLKGLHTAPRIGEGLSVKDIDVMVSPECWGPPHKACCEHDIPIIIVRENKTIYSTPFGYPAYKYCTCVDNYLEAAGVIIAMKAGITLTSVRRPIPPTEILHG